MVSEHEELKVKFLIYGWPETAVGRFDVVRFDGAYERWEELHRSRWEVDENKNDNRGRGKVDGDENASSHERQGTGEAEGNRNDWGYEEVKKKFGKMKALTKMGWKKAWKDHIQDGVDQKIKSLVRYKGDGKQFIVDEEIKRLIAGVAALKERLKHVDERPKTVWDATKRKPHQNFICCK